MIFVDTGAWFALFNRTDPDHAAANAWLSTNLHPLVTSHFVLDELLTLLRVRGMGHQAIQAGEALVGQDLARLVEVRPEDIRGGWEFFTCYSDKRWSFTDCVSFSMMQRLRIDTAFAFDDHFRQVGRFVVVP